MKNTVLLLGAFDTKAADYAFLRDRILQGGCEVLAVNTGVLGTTDLFPVAVEAGEVARAGGSSLADLRARQDRGAAMKVMAAGAAAVVRRLFAENKFQAVIGMGGTGGTSVVTAAMRELPLGVPKLCVSTAAAGDTAPYLGTRDVVLFPAIVDVAGLNRISRPIYCRAAGAICGMLAAAVPPSTDDKPIVAASMFGNTTACVNACAEALRAEHYEVLVFHATGTGGKTMEALVDDGLVDAVLDITTTEWADTVCGGVFDAGPDRLSAPGRKKIPHLIVPGCVDMCNFGALNTVPPKYRDAGRLFYEWNPAVTLMRTNAAENAQMGQIFADKANAAHAAGAPVAFLVPLRGVSILDGDGQRFCDRAADQAMFDAIRKNLAPGIRYETIDANINDSAFSAQAVAMLLDLIAAQKK